MGASPPKTTFDALPTIFGRLGSACVIVLGSQGEHRGQYFVSKDGARDGENLWDAQDADGQYFIRPLVETALALAPGETTTVRYQWQNPGEAAPRWKVVQLAYFAPRDWVIGISSYEDELTSYSRQAARDLQNTILLSGSIGAVLIGLASLAAGAFSRSLTRPIRAVVQLAQQIADGDMPQLTRAAAALAGGDLTPSVQVRAEAVAVRSDDEVGALAQALGQLVARLHEVGRSFDAMAAQLGQQIGAVARTANGVAAAVAQLTTAAAQASEATTQIAATMQQVAQGTQRQAESITQTMRAADQMKRAIEGVASGAQEQAQAVTRTSVVVSQLSSAVEGIRQGADAQTDAVARAGEHGKGFAVVADEVRKLAERSAQATKEIGEMVWLVQSGAVEVAEAMQATGRDVSAAVMLSERAGSAFETTAANAQNVNTQSQSVQAVLERMQAASARRPAPPR